MVVSHYPLSDWLKRFQSLTLDNLIDFALEGVTTDSQDLCLILFCRSIHACFLMLLLLHLGEDV